MTKTQKYQNSYIAFIVINLGIKLFIHDVIYCINYLKKTNHIQFLENFGEFIQEIFSIITRLTMSIIFQFLFLVKIII